MASRPKKQASSSPSAQIIEFCEKYLLTPEGAAVGKPIRIRPWQASIISGIYDQGNIRRAIISVARKNGKTALAAMLLLAHLVGPKSKKNAQIYSAAQSRDQASIVFGLAAKMVRMSPALNELVTVRDSAKELFCTETGVRYKALSADATTAYGLSPSFTIHDELGQVRGPRSELYDALETAAGAQENPLSVIISTQAPTDADLLSTLIDDAKRPDNKRTKLFLFAADPEDDPWDEDTWRKANPALNDFNSFAEMEELASSAKRLPALENSFRNLNLNQRVSAEAHFISPDVWALNAGEPDLGAFEDNPVFVGADLSATQDLTAVVAVARDKAGIWHVRPWFFLPGNGLEDRGRADREPYSLWAKHGFIIPIQGARSIDEDYIARLMAPILSRLDVRAFAYDRWQFHTLLKAFQRVGYEPPFLTDFGQGYKSMSPALKALESELLAGKIRHGSNPVLTMCISNARVQMDEAGNRKLSKKHATGRIDGAIALTMAIGAGVQELDATKPPPPNFENSLFFFGGKRPRLLARPPR